MTDLNPCPFCGKTAEHDTYDPFDGYQGDCTVHRVRCTGCGAEVKAKTEAAAISRWNTRFTIVPASDFFEKSKANLDFFTIYGFPLSSLIIVAEALRDSTVTPEEAEKFVRDFRRQIELIYKSEREAISAAFEDIGIAVINQCGRSK